MQIEIEREALLRPIGIVASVVERRQTLPILSYVLVKSEGGSISFTGTDLEVEMIVRASGKVGKAGECTLPARKLFEICRALPVGVSVNLEGQSSGRVLLKSGKSRFSLSTLPPDDFPNVAAGSFEPAFTVSNANLKRLFERTAFCMAQQDVRYYLNGLYLEFDGHCLRAVATDGHRMAVGETECRTHGNNLSSVIVPRKAVQELAKLIPSTDEPLDVQISGNHLRLSIEDLTFTSKLIEGKFPDYTKVIPVNQSKILILNREYFRSALARVAILANEKYRGIRLSLERGKLSITAHNPDQEEASEELDANYSGESLEIGFNVNYLLEASAAITSDEFTLGLNDSNSSCTIAASDKSNARYVVMPMRL